LISGKIYLGVDCNHFAAKTFPVESVTKILLAPRPHERWSQYVRGVQQESAPEAIVRNSISETRSLQVARWHTRNNGGGDDELIWSDCLSTAMLTIG